MWESVVFHSPSALNADEWVCGVVGPWEFSSVQGRPKPFLLAVLAFFPLSPFSLLDGQKMSFLPGRARKKPAREGGREEKTIWYERPFFPFRRRREGWAPGGIRKPFSSPLHFLVLASFNLEVWSLSGCLVPSRCFSLSHFLCAR